MEKCCSWKGFKTRTFNCCMMGTCNYHVFLRLPQISRSTVRKKTRCVYTIMYLLKSWIKGRMVSLKSCKMPPLWLTPKFWKSQSIILAHRLPSKTSRMIKSISNASKNWATRVLQLLLFSFKTWLTFKSCSSSRRRTGWRRCTARTCRMRWEHPFLLRSTLQTCFWPLRKIRRNASISRSSSSAASRCSITSTIR